VLPADRVEHRGARPVSAASRAVWPYHARVRGNNGVVGSRSLCRYRIGATPRRGIEAYGHGVLVAALACASCRDAPAPSARETDAKQPPAVVIQVAAASDLTRAFEQLGRVFESKIGQKVAFTFGASGVLAQQLRAGAPFDMFASANSAFVSDVVTAGVCDRATQALYAHGQLVVWTRRGGVQPAASLADLADPRFRKIAIANPEHAPYGKAAREALQKQGLWAALERRIVYGENNRQAHQFAQSGNAEAALIALSLVIGTSDGAYVPVDESLHAPIDQTLVACQRGKNPDGGRAFASFVHSMEGRALMRRHGFLLPGEAPPRTR
jgi:molybdate transport system substrate-binding protein